MGYKVNSSRGKSEFDEFIKTVEDAMANGDSGLRFFYNKDKIYFEEE